MSVMKKVAKKKGNIPTVEVLRFEPINDRDVRLITTNLDVAIQVDLPSSSEITEPFEVNFYGFDQVLRNKKSDEVTLTPDYMERKLIVQQGNRTVSLLFRDLGDYPAHPEIADYETLLLFNISPHDWEAIQRSVLPFAATDDSRPTLAGVLVEHADGNRAYCAADGFQLGLYTTYAEYPDPAPENFIVPASTLKMIPKASSQIRFHSRQEHSKADLTFFYKGVKFHLITRLIDGYFPDYRQIIPDENESQLHVHTDVIAEASRLNLNSQLLTFEDGSAYGKQSDVGEYKWNGTSVRLHNAEACAFNTSYLMKMVHLSDTSNDRLTMTTGRVMGGWKAQKGNELVVTMPMVVGDK